MDVYFLYRDGKYQRTLTWSEVQSLARESVGTTNVLRVEFVPTLLAGPVTIWDYDPTEGRFVRQR